MKRIQLNRQNHLEAKVKLLDEVIYDLRALLDDEFKAGDEIWMKNYKAIVEFQDTDGSFNLLDTFKVESDVQVDYCYTPTYLCSAIIMKAFMTGVVPEEDAKRILSKSLKVCCRRELKGHGYESFIGEYDALNIFMSAGLREFIMYHGDICPEFSEMIKGKKIKFRDMIVNKDFEDIWSSKFEEKVRTLDSYFSNNSIFVYGTLLSGEKNHSKIEESTLKGKAAASGLVMYDVGSFPGVVPGNSTVTGEVYEVTDEMLDYLDYFEGEGDLYLRKSIAVKMDSGDTVITSIYEYNGPVKGLQQIPNWLQPYTADWEAKKDKYVWYVSYGSNMNYERFMCYIKGGSYKGGAFHKACSDLSNPVKIETFDIPFNMYFRNSSSSWDNKGVAFLDITKGGSSLGVAYLVTREQFRHISCEENGGTPPERSINWYNEVLSLGIHDGYEVVTITNRETCNYNEPSEGYLETIKEGIQNNYPGMSDIEISQYFERCINNR